MTGHSPAVVQGGAEMQRPLSGLQIVPELQSSPPDSAHPAAHAPETQIVFGAEQPWSLVQGAPRPSRSVPHPVIGQLDAQRPVSRSQLSPAPQLPCGSPQPGTHCALLQIVCGGRQP